MGIPLSDRVYEYVPEDSVDDKVARELFVAYTELSQYSNRKNMDGVQWPVSLIDWVDYF